MFENISICTSGFQWLSNSCKWGANGSLWHARCMYVLITHTQLLCTGYNWRTSIMLITSFVSPKWLPSQMLTVRTGCLPDVLEFHISLTILSECMNADLNQMSLSCLCQNCLIFLGISSWTMVSINNKIPWMRLPISTTSVIYRF